MDYKKLAHQIIPIARQAGAAILEIYHKAGDIQVENKDDKSPLTLADKAANDIICEGLNQLEKVFPIISEENKQVDYDVRKAYDYYWLVDPLDGTKEFIKRNGEFTVNIALIHQQMPVLGVVYAPDLDDMYWAAKDIGAYMVTESGEQKLDAQQFGMQDKNLRVVCSRSHLNEGTQTFVDALIEPELVATGSSLKFLIIAKGQAHLYPRLAPTMEWDTAAAQIVLEEAGGEVLNDETKKPLSYNKENLLNPHFIASAKVDND